jgi:hypothetical protein
MKKIQLLSLLLISVLSAAAQSGDPAFSNTHRSTTLSYGVSALAGLGAYSKDGGAAKGITFGPISITGNKALSSSFSFHWGPSLMYYRYKYSYQADGATDEGTINLLFGGFTLGANYHIVATEKLDPYVGVSGGVGYFYDLNGTKDNSYSLGGSIPLLYGLKVGVNAYGKSNNAWTFELGYDYLSYLKVGYTFVKSK